MSTSESHTFQGDAARKAAYDIERLLQFGMHRKLLEPLDAIAARNALLDMLKLEESYEGECEDASGASVNELLAPLLDYAALTGLLEEDNTTLRDLLDARIMGALLPRPSEVIHRFWATAKREGIERATDDFYKLSTDSNYIRMDRINNNLYWLAATDYGDLEITVNLSKPEKDPKEIAMLKNAKASHYPKCLLCVENVGYAGRLNHPARQNLRVIPLELTGEPWYFQYSPYVYYNEHSIIFDREHRPMKMSRYSFERLLDFVELFPHYFIGSNADLPIVGGSILSHDHFQGGRHKFPMELAPVEAKFSSPAYSGVKLGIVKWPMSVLRISSHDRVALLELASHILDSWRAYSDPASEVLAFSEQDGAQVPHNTVTPIARNNASGEYELDLVLRNNRTSEEHPDGIFHPHQELHHIKKENIGLIEVMGLAVLPGRLKDELELAAGALTGELQPDAIAADAQHPLHKHASWLQELARKHGTAQTREQAALTLQAEVGRKFESVLTDAGVFKRNDAGQEAFRRFVRQLGFE
ncbi:UDPglucose--hexose-1-phosphate uridylyltransferase [Paenibacillus sp. UNCCL117]|uniref:UDP-glucose--hexose-1-phosphate uridylyltransferase n=1 Tax=unclassified Paenibacillus TaxID=185978 RepID=UPI000880AFD9|nr:MULTISPECIES: UDP-glucose--hexose-1-phosphate uridylyltransferase [unclassified Paenibacillus]SDD16041.1 UDPglucose--hexose-1-phosphate uridylyltransferase [Paenibacillus sp. cl123]SFW34596.1 UDPglucose--hexose-1-phosphate uridylyltransferase [Paenibacillus sp. UNCCL117]